MSLLAGLAVFLALVIAPRPGRGAGARRWRAVHVGRATARGPGPAGSGAAVVQVLESVRVLRRGRGRAGGAPEPAVVAALADRVAGLCRAGLPLSRVWSVLAEHDQAAPPTCSRVAATVSLGGSSAEGLRLAAAPGGGPLAWLALACAIAEDDGAPVAGVLEGIAAVIRSDEDARRERDGALAGPRATASVLSWLPLAGLGLGVIIGIDPLSVLVGSAAGRACLLTGALAWTLGWWWMRGLVRRAGRVVAR